MNLSIYKKIATDVEQTPETLLYQHLQLNLKVLMELTLKIYGVNPLMVILYMKKIRGEF